MLREPEILSMLMRRKPAHSLAQDLYCDPGVFQADLENLWYREWLFAIPACKSQSRAIMSSMTWAPIRW